MLFGLVLAVTCMHVAYAGSRRVASQRNRCRLTPWWRERGDRSVLRSLLVRTLVQLVCGVSILLHARHTTPSSSRWSAVSSG